MADRPEPLTVTPPPEHDEAVQAILREKWPCDWMPAFLVSLRSNANARLACRAAGVNRAMAYKARDKWAGFRAAWDDCLEDALDALEAVAWDRARKQSDYLLWKLLAANRREKYGDAIRVNLDLEHEARKIIDREGLPPEQAGRLLSISEKLKQRSTG